MSVEYTYSFSKDVLRVEKLPRAELMLANSGCKRVGSTEEKCIAQECAGIHTPCALLKMS